MARGDECKTTTKANIACKTFGITAPVKKPSVPNQTSKKQEPNYGSWGPVYKDKNTFANMHIC